MTHRDPGPATAGADRALGTDRIADARPLDEYLEILTAAGLRTVHTERHDQAMRRMIDQIEARLNLLRINAPDKLTTAVVDVNLCLPASWLDGSPGDSRWRSYLVQVGDRCSQTVVSAATGSVSAGAACHHSPSSSGGGIPAVSWPPSVTPRVASVAP